MSELQKAAELEYDREFWEKFRNATRYSKWLQRKRRVKAYEANLTSDMVQNAGR